MSKPLITIVVPVYKVPEPMLIKCLDSIAAQTDPQYEAILIDDGSPDGCGAVCDAYAAQYPAFRVIHQENGGLSVVRNNGIRAAQGNWVCFVDGDDWIEPETVAFAKKYAEECPDGDVLIWDEYYDFGTTVKENCFIRDHADGKRYVFAGERREILYDMFFPLYYRRFEGNFVDIGTCNARLYKRSFLLEENLFNVPGLRRMQDNEFNLRVFDRAERVYYQCRRLYHYSFNTEAATQKYAPDNYKTMDFLYECMRQFVRESRNTPEYEQRLYSRFIRIFGEIFKLNFANPKNPDGLAKRIRNARAIFSDGNFREVIDGFDSNKNHSKRIRLIHRLFKRNRYFLLILYYAVSIRTRRLRLLRRSG